MLPDHPRPSRREVCFALTAAATAPLAGCVAGGPTVVPDVELPGPAGLTRHGWAVVGIARGSFRNRVSVLNVWASWCGYCRGEHELLMRLSQNTRFRLVGLVVHDEEAQASAYLKKAGNPFAAVALDQRRALAGPLGQRGVPGTYVIDRSGRVTARLRGAMTEQTVATLIMPAVRSALEQTPAPG